MKLDFKGFSKDQLVQFQDSIQGPARFFKVQDGTSKIRFFVLQKRPPLHPSHAAEEHETSIRSFAFIFRTVTTSNMVSPP